MKWHGRLGVPYQGSKNAIARDIISILPSGRRFVDLFAGGCAMTHAAILSGKYERFLANDLHGFGIRLFVDAIAGKCNGRWREWVSREGFNRRKETDPLVALCWSFSNNGRDYLYGREVEEQKRRAHEYILKAIDAGICTVGDYQGHLKAYARRNEIRPEVEVLERVEMVERLQALEADYQQIDIRQGDIVYCDPPYKGTQRYNTEGCFDHDAFWDWCASRDYPVFVSEYTAPEGFVPIWRKGKCRLMNQNGADGKAVEKVFVAERWANEYQSDLFPDF